METKLVNIYHKLPYDVYIGRAGHGQSGEFGNPYSNGTRDENIKAFKKYFYERIKTDHEFARKIISLKGKTLGCFCKPKPCHGDIIVEYLNNLPDRKFVKMAVVGSRSFTNYTFLEEILNWYDIKMIISGGARGADLLAKKYAMVHQIPYKEFIPDWDRLGKAAAFHRNKQIVEACEEMVAFWDGRSKGTQHTIQLAEKNNKPVYIFRPPIVDELAEIG